MSTLTRRGALTGAAALLPRRDAVAAVRARRELRPEAFGAVGDGGADDAAALQALFDAATPGDVVRLARAYAIGPAGVSLEGKRGLLVEGPGHIVVAGAPSRRVRGFSPAAIKLSACQDVTLRGLSFDGRGVACIQLGLEECSDCTLEELAVFAGASGTAQIVSVAGRRNRYLRNVVRDAAARGTRGLWVGNIFSSQVEEDAEIVGNRALANGGTGIVYTGRGGTIAGNESGRNRGAGIVIAGGLEARSERVAVRGNTCSANGYHGIQCDVAVADPAAFPAGCVVDGNNCVGNVFSGIFAVHSTGWRITRNVCLDNAAGGSFSSGVTLDNYCSDVLVAENRCADRRSAGERTQANGVSCVAAGAPGMLKTIRIEANVMENHREAGLILAANGRNDIHDVLVRANTIRGNAVGIRVQEALPNHVIGLRLEANRLAHNRRAVEADLASPVPTQLRQS